MSLSMCLILVHVVSQSCDFPPPKQSYQNWCLHQQQHISVFCLWREKELLQLKIHYSTLKSTCNITDICDHYNVGYRSDAKMHAHTTWHNVKFWGSSYPPAHPKWQNGISLNKQSCKTKQNELVPHLSHTSYMTSHIATWKHFKPHWINYPNQKKHYYNLAVSHQGNSPIPTEWKRTIPEAIE